MHPRELPDLRLIPSPQIWEAAPVPQPEIISEPNHVEPLLRPGETLEEWRERVLSAQLVMTLTVGPVPLRFVRRVTEVESVV